MIFDDWSEGPFLHFKSLGLNNVALHRLEVNLVVKLDDIDDCVFFAFAIVGNFDVNPRYAR